MIGKANSYFHLIVIKSFFDERRKIEKEKADKNVGGPTDGGHADADHAAFCSGRERGSFL